MACALLLTVLLSSSPGAEWARQHFPEMPGPIPVVVYRAGEPPCGLPLGGLGTGSIELDGTGRFGGSTVQYSVRPGPVIPEGAVAVWARAGLQTGVCLLQTNVSAEVRGLRDARFSGHWPVAELQPVGDGLPVRVHLRAWSPVVPGAAEISNTPALLLRLYVQNESATSAHVVAAFAWPNEGTTPWETPGNVGGWLGWQREGLGPGEKWQVRLAMAVGGSPAQARACAGKALQAALPSNFPRAAAEQVVISAPGLEAFFADQAAGFNWEARGLESFRRTGEKGHIGQMAWALHYVSGEQKRAAAFFASGQDCQLDGARLESCALSPAGDAARWVMLSDDRLLRIVITDHVADGAVCRSYEVENLSDKPVERLLLGHYVNWDLGGPDGQESDDRGKALPQGRLEFTDEHSTAVMAGEPQPELFSLGGWRGALDSLYAGKGEAFANIRPTVKLVNRPMANGLYLGDSGGRSGYLLAAWGKHKQLLPSCGGLRDWWPAFARTGELTGGREGGRVGVVAASLDVAPHARGHLDFALCWYFPELRDDDGKLIGRWYTRRFESAQAVASWLSQPGRRDDLLRRTLAWQQRIYTAAIPPWLQDAMINGLYSWARNTTWIADGRFAHSESFVGCPITETIVCRFSGSWPLMLLFPDLERNTMRQFILHQRQDGAIPFAFGGGLRYDSPYYDTQKSLDSAEFVLMAWRDYWHWRDRAWLREALPAVKRAVDYCRTLDTDGDGLINEVSMQYYDCWPFYGTSAYVAGIWLAALRAAEEMAKVDGDEGFARQCREWFQRGREAYEAKLWNGRYYRLYNEPETGKISEVCLGNQLAGQGYAYLCGLGELVPGEHIASALSWVSKLNGASSPYGVTNGVQPSGVVEPGPHSDCVSIGETFNYAATCICAGLPDLGLPEAQEAYDNVVLKQKTPWNIFFNHSAQDGHMIWGQHYYSNMSVWTIGLALVGDQLRYW